MQQKIMFLIPRDSMSDDDRDYYKKLHPEIDFTSVDPFHPLTLVEAKAREGVEIVAGRGNTAVEIRGKVPGLHVVEVPITPYDIIRSINMADYHGKTIAVITNNASIIGLDIFAELYNIRILSYLLVPFAKLHETIRGAASRGADYIMGGAITCMAARELGVPVLTIRLGPESMQSAFNEIRQIREAIEVESQRQGFLNNLMDNIVEGVVATDDRGKITTANSVAERLTGKRRSELLHQPIDTLLAGVQGADKPADFEGLLTIDGNRVMVEPVPMVHAGQHYGTIYTMHESRRIESMENAIRTETYSKTHRARYRFSDVIGASEAIADAVARGRSFAKTQSGILISGPSGTGKEVFAQSIHNLSDRSSGAFVAVNCAALPAELLESELFGYVEGAFTGATRGGKKGLFEIAHGGTIFLDEISEMAYPSQAALLRVIQERYIVRLGSYKIIPVDVRIIAATNRDLKRLVARGDFREDLYYRLNVLNLHLPPLAMRGQDVLTFLAHFLNRLPSPHRGGFTLSPEAAELALSHPWPGNIRELRNVCERIVAMAKSPVVDAAALLAALSDGGDLSAPVDPVSADSHPAPHSAKGQIQALAIEDALRQSGGHMGRAAELLGIDRTTLYRRMKRLGLS